VIVGVARFRLRLPENSSLKGKRGVVKSLCARIQGEFRVAAAEVDEQDVWQIAEIGSPASRTTGGTPTPSWRGSCASSSRAASISSCSTSRPS